MTNCTDLIAPTMDALLACARQALKDCNRDVGRASLVPGGQVAWDDCCSGQLFVKMDNIVPSGGDVPFPNQNTIQKCGVSLLAVTFTVGVLRCASTVDDNGVAPSVSTLTNEAHGMTADASILLQALMCCAKNISGVQISRIGGWSPLGVQGGCAGGEWKFTVGLGTCGC